MVAIEGPSRAGKTSLIQYLQSLALPYSVAAVPCFSVYAGGPAHLPPLVPASASERLSAVATLVDLDSRRTAHVREARAELTLLDRSCLTLTAHSYAFEKSLSEPMLAATEEIVCRSNCLLPDLALFLETPETVRISRGVGQFPPDDPGMVGLVQNLVAQYFHSGPRLGVPIAFVRGDMPIQQVSAQALAFIAAHKRLQH